MKRISEIMSETDTCPICGGEYRIHHEAVSPTFINKRLRSDVSHCDKKVGYQAYDVWVHAD